MHNNPISHGNSFASLNLPPSFCAPTSLLQAQLKSRWTWAMVVSFQSQTIQGLGRTKGFLEDSEACQRCISSSTHAVLSNAPELSRHASLSPVCPQHRFISGIIWLCATDHTGSRCRDFGIRFMKRSYSAFRLSAGFSKVHRANCFISRWNSTIPTIPGMGTPQWPCWNQPMAHTHTWNTLHKAHLHVFNLSISQHLELLLYTK